MLTITICHAWRGTSGILCKRAASHHTCHACQCTRPISHYTCYTCLGTRAASTIPVMHVYVHVGLFLFHTCRACINVPLGIIPIISACITKPVKSAYRTASHYTSHACMHVPLVTIPVMPVCMEPVTALIWRIRTCQPSLTTPPPPARKAGKVGRVRWTLYWTLFHSLGGHYGSE